MILIIFCFLIIIIFFVVQAVILQKRGEYINRIWTYFIYTYICLYMFIYIYIYLYIFLYEKFVIGYQNTSILAKIT